MEYSSGVVHEPGTRLVLGMRRETEKQQPSVQLLALFHEMHAKRVLSDLFRLPADSLVL